MKSLAVISLGFFALLDVGQSYADTIDLPLPTIRQILTVTPNFRCSFVNQVHPYTIVTGFDSTGNFVLGSASNVAKCGGGGRDVPSYRYPYCASFMWDLAGNLVSTIIGTCSPTADYSKSYTNAGGYTAYTFVQFDYGYLQYEYPELITP